MLSSVDVGPTILGLCGVTAPESMQGDDRSSDLRALNPREDGATEQFSLYYRWDSPSAAGELRGIRTREWKFVAKAAEDHVATQLFHLPTDPDELQPVKDEAVERRLAGSLRSELARVGEPWPPIDLLCER